MRLAIATAPVERPKDLVDSIKKQRRDSYAKTLKIDELKE
jgi:hypothetical protein